MTKNAVSVEVLFRDHSFEEIESVRDNLANEIDKRTELLKSIVKEKYRDIVETSDAIQAMKLNLDKVETSIKSLDKNISELYTRLQTADTTDQVSKHDVAAVCSDSKGESSNHGKIDKKTIIDSLVQKSAAMWDKFDSGDYKQSLRLHNESIQSLEEYITKEPEAMDDQVLVNLQTNLRRVEDVMKNHFWHKIRSAESNQIGIIRTSCQDDLDSDQENLFTLCMQSATKFLVENLRQDISNTSYYAQIKRYQPYSFFNIKTNQIEPEVDDYRPPAEAGCHIQIPKYISVELSSFLHETCRVINTISGFNLSKSSIISSLRATVLQILEVYSELIPKLDNDLKGESKRRRAMQLYYDLMYVRILLNTSKDLEIIEELDPKISGLAGEFELMLDSIQLYMISDAMHTNVLRLIHSTIRLYGLLVPHLQ